MSTVTEKVFDYERLVQEARTATGLLDLGDPRHEGPFRVMLESYEAMPLTPRGKKSTRRRMLTLLVNRLRVVDALAKHPEIRERTITRPLFLTGLPRTGTSATFNLLAADPTARPLLFWEGTHPDPYAGVLEEGAEDPRLVALRDALERGRKANPDFAAIHDVRADGPEECVQLLAHSLAGVQLGVEPLFEPYRSSFFAQDLRAPYEQYRDLLKLLDWQRPGERWLLKTPAHLFALDLLAELFPDGTVVITHRDLLECVPSYCSMVRSMLSEHETVDPRYIGEVVLDYLARSMERAMEARTRIEAGRIVDVAYKDFIADPVGTGLRIHHAAGLDAGPRVEAAFRAHADAHPKNKHGKHDYGLEAFGLTEAGIRARFADYAKAYGVTFGGRA